MHCLLLAWPYWHVLPRQTHEDAPVWQHCSEMVPKHCCREAASGQVLAPAPAPAVALALELELELELAIALAVAPASRRERRGGEE